MHHKRKLVLQLKKAYKKPEILVESLLASEYYAAGCAPDYAEGAKTFLADMACAEAYNDFMGYVVIDNDPQEGQYCYNNGSMKILMS